MNIEVLILRHKQKMPSEYKPPPNISRLEDKPLKVCSKIFISPGLIFGILWYVIQIYSVFIVKSHLTQARFLLNAYITALHEDIPNMSSLFPLVSTYSWLVIL